MARMCVRPSALRCGAPQVKPIASARTALLLLTGVEAIILAPEGHALPAFAQQTGQACKSCHVGGFGPELTPFGREFKLGGYTLRTHAAIPLAAMTIMSFTHTRKSQERPAEHLSPNNNFVLDQASLFVAGGLGDHFGGFAQVTYDGIARHWTWDNLDLRAVTKVKIAGEDSLLGLSINNNPTVEDAWNTLPAWGFPFTDAAVSPTPAAAPLINRSLAQNVIGVSAYGWVGHKLYLAVGGYTSPSVQTLKWLGTDPFSPGSVHGIAPYGRIAFQTQVAGGTFEAGASSLKASIFPARDRSTGLSDHYADVGFDMSWQKAFGPDGFSASLRYEHERADLRASCAVALIGNGTNLACARYRLREVRAYARYMLHDRWGLSISAFRIGGSRNVNVFTGNGLPDSNGLMGQIDYTLWPNGKGPLGPLFNVRVGAQSTLYGKFNGARHNFDGAGANAADNNAVRLFTWIAF